MAHLWLRAETKAFEKRTPLVPEHAGALVRAGYQVTVERCPQRVCSDKAYEKQGATLVPKNSWPEAPLDAWILGIKELPEDTTPIRHKHLYFAHVFKGQQGAKAVLQRYIAGGGTLFDIEYLTDFRHLRLIRSSGFWAGYCGAAISLYIWCQKQLGGEPPFAIAPFYKEAAVLINRINHLLEKIEKPTVLIIGPNGMTGQGARSFLDHLTIPHDGWTKSHTAKKGPFFDILNYDILLNCILLTPTTSLFLDEESLANNKKLSVIGDISCDPLSPHNPLPLFKHPTTFAEPTCRVGSKSFPVDIMAIDHITTLLPKEASYAFSEQLFPFLCQLLIMKDDLSYSPWQKVKDKFIENTRQKW